MIFVPSGSFNIKDGSDQKTISIDAFWMSNEISNKEFRDFFEQLKRTPNDTICRIDFSKMKSDKNQKPTIIKNSHSEIINRLMSESAWKIIPGKKNYFTDPKYDNDPVVGVTYEGATYYCIWRTNQENEKLRKKGKPTTHNFRLPTELEWEYASTQIVKGSSCITAGENKTKELIAPDKASKSIGFRMVKSTFKKK